MGVVVRGCHCHDPDKGVWEGGGCGLPSAEAGEESAVGRVCAAGLLLALLVPSLERRILSEDVERYILWFQRVFLKITGLGSANVD